MRLIPLRRSLSSQPLSWKISFAVTWFLSLAALWLGAAAAPTRAADNPNVIVILTDDQGWGDLSLNGNKNINTPSLDALGRIGARFDRFYVCPVCAPTRAEFLTGRYHPRAGVRGVTSGAERLDLDEKTIAQHFKAAGYKTAAFGKWHNGMQYPYHPNARGFDEFYGYCSGHWGDYFSPQLEHNGKLVQGDGYLVDDFTNRAMNFIEENQNQPFFVYLPMPTPHAPMQVPDKYWDRLKERPISLQATEADKEDKQFTRAALAMVECIDDNVGRLLRKLDALSLSTETIVVFFCDNGPNSHRWNGGMKGKKATTDEGGVRSPMFLSWPGKIRSGRVVSQIAAGIDLMPTLCELAGVPIVGGKPLDGVSLEPLLMGKAGAIPNRMIFSHWNKKVSVRTQHFRLDHRGKLYDMVIDPGQTQAINEGKPEIAQELKKFVEAWKSRVMTDRIDERPFPVGHPNFRWTQLPARDAKFTGEIQRSAKAPNCSYLTNWTNTSDKAYWDIEVLEAGKFEVEMHYACAKEGIGSVVELEYGKRKITRIIEEENDPPTVGAKNDRVTRTTQSFMKDFKPLKLGTIQLPRGKGKLTLTAPVIEKGANLEVP